MEFRLLGPIEVVEGDRLLDVGGRRHRGLLALLALHPNEVLPAPRLIDELWAGKPSPRAANTLQSYVSDLRASLEPDRVGRPKVLVTRQPGYVLEVEPDWIDVEVVKRQAARGRAALTAERPAEATRELTSALELWRGAPLADLAGEPFATRHADHLQELRLSIEEDLVQAELALGHHLTMVSRLEGLVRDQPFRERLWAQLLVALYRAGRQVDALRAYHRFRSRLVEELGIEPGPELRGLERAILQQDPGLDWRPSSGRPASVGPGRAVPSSEPLVPLLAELRIQGPFVGRQLELERLGSCWRRAAAGRSATALVCGEPGIGKTALAAQLAARIYEDGGIVLYGRCEEDLEAPYQPFIDAILTYVRTLRGAQLRTWPPWVLAELARVMPELAERVPELPQPLRGGPELERHILHQAFAHFLDGAATDHAVLVVVDDLQWATKPTLLLLRHLVGGDAGRRLLILGTYRDTELGPQHPLSSALADLHHEPGVERFALSGFDRKAVAAYLVACGEVAGSHTDRLAETLAEATGGNPFFVREVLASLRESALESGHGVAAPAPGATPVEVRLPASVRDVIERRLGRLSESANRVLTVAAVIGRSFRLAVLERIPDAGPPTALLEALEEATVASLCVDEGTHFSFTHALIRQALLARLSPTRLTRLHRLVGEAIEALPDPDIDALTHHFASAAADGQADKAARYALASGRRAYRLLAIDQASVTLQCGLTLLERSPQPDEQLQLDIELALVTVSGSAWHRSRRELALRALQRARDLGDADRTAQAALALKGEAVLGKPDPELAQALDDALARIETDPARRVKVLASLAFYRLIGENDCLAAEQLARESMTLARHVGDDETLGVALLTRFHALLPSTQLEERRAINDELTALAERAGNVTDAQQAALNRATLALERGDRAAYAVIMRERELAATRLGMRAPWQGWHDTLVALLDGCFDEVEPLARAALAETGESPHPDMIIACLAQLCLLGRERGWHRQGVPVVEAAVAASPKLVSFYAGLGAARAEAGDLVGARQVLQDLVVPGAWSLPCGIDYPLSLALLAETCAVVDDRERAAILYERLTPFHGRAVLLPLVGVLGAADRFLGMLAAVLGERYLAEAHYETALDLEERLASPPLVARTRLWHARLLASRGGPSDLETAADLCQAALATAEELRMPMLADHARELLRDVAGVERQGIRS